MKKGFFVGFILSLVIVLFPVFLYMDARSSSPRTSNSYGVPNVPDPFISGSIRPDRPTGPSRPPSGTGNRDSAKTDDREKETDPDEKKAENIVMLKNRELPKKSFQAPKHEGIRTRVYDPNRIYTLRTAISHVSLIDLPEEAKEVYMGDSKLFLAEVFGSRVKVKPITYDLASKTNMIIYTIHKRFTFRVKTVPPGEEDDLTTFLSPDAETVVNLNPLKTVIREHLEKKEARDLEVKRTETLKQAGPTMPLRIEGETHGILFSFLGFSRNQDAYFGLLEIQNGNSRRFYLSGVRIRKYKSGLFWEGQKEYDPRSDWSQSFNTWVDPGMRKRFLVRIGHVPGLSDREGIRVVVEGTLKGEGDIRWNGDSRGVFR
jgi:hypothetical protein